MMGLPKHATPPPSRYSITAPRQQAARAMKYSTRTTTLGGGVEGHAICVGKGVRSHDTSGGMSAKAKRAGIKPGPPSVVVLL